MPLPPVQQLTAESTGLAFYLCAHKEVRPGKNGEFISLTLQDATGRVTARIFDEVERLKGEFEAGDFVKVKARGNLYNGRVQLIVENIRRVIPELDRGAGFREEDCVPASPRPLEEMWRELDEAVASVKDPCLARLLRAVVDRYADRLRVWPAAQLVHHAYRGGFLEHVLQITRVATTIADAYGADRDLVLAGSLLHDIGKLRELEYEAVASYTPEGRLIGHITLGVAMLQEIAAGIDGFPPALLLHLQHMIVSHHGERELGSPVEPMTPEAFIVSMCDDLDAKIHQVRQALRDEGGEGDFSAYQQRHGRPFWRGTITKA